MKYGKLDPAAIAEALRGLPDWTISADGCSITRSFVFTDFGEAFAFMTRSALAAERLDHHPEWSNVYRLVDVTLTTHSAKGLTELDFRLAAAMERAAWRHD
jgi:4a-hydroxytetrahydrobiopterin dehydratase